MSLSTVLRAGAALPERPRGWADRPRSTTREPATHRRREVTAEAGRMRGWRRKAELEDPSGVWAWNPLRLRTCQKTRQERPLGTWRDLVGSGLGRGEKRGEASVAEGGFRQRRAQLSKSERDPGEALPWVRMLRVGGGRGNCPARPTEKGSKKPGLKMEACWWEQTQGWRLGLWAGLYPPTSQFIR